MVKRVKSYLKVPPLTKGGRAHATNAVNPSRTFCMRYIPLDQLLVALDTQYDSSADNSDVTCLQCRKHLPIRTPL